MNGDGNSACPVSNRTPVSRTKGVKESSAPQAALERLGQVWEAGEDVAEVGEGIDVPASGYPSGIL